MTTENRKTVFVARDLVQNYIACLEALRRGEKRHLNSGFSDLDQRLPAWLHDGHLIVVAGRPSMGKSTFAQQLGENIAERGRTTLMFTLEMTGHEIAERSLSRRSGVPVPVLKTGENIDARWNEIARAVGEFVQLPYMVDDTSYELEVILRKARQVAATLNGEGFPPLGCIIVDYLQLVAAEAANRNLEVGAVASALKRLAKELCIPVIALAQLNRSVEGRVDKRPTLADLRESGQIEQDADLVLFLYRDDYYHKEKSEDPGVAEVIAAKNRHGATDTIRLAFIPERLLFGGLSK